MEQQALFDADAFDVRIRPEQKSHVAAALEVRSRSLDLRSEVSGGHYNDRHLREFWKLVSDAPFILRTSAPELSERGGLGSRFFSTVASEGRSPKFPNMLRALTAIIDVANERLADVDATESKLAAGWMTNPLEPGSLPLQQLEADLALLIANLKSSNSLSEVHGLDREYRETLADMLETVATMLRAPLIERSLVVRSAAALKEAVSKVASDSSAGFFGGLAGAAAAELLKLLT